MTNKGIKGWPEDERPRERLIKKGTESLSDSQLLAIIIRNGTKNRSAIDLALDLLKKFGNLNSLSNTTILELCQIEGIGPSKAAQIKAALEIGKRVLANRLQSNNNAVIKSSDIYNYFLPLLHDLKKEIFKTILLDRKNNIIRDVTISEGSLNLSIVHPREAFNPAVRDSASSVIFIHNHPSGDPTPSNEDIEITKRLISAGEIIGIKVLDHIIIGSKGYVSFADRGLM